MGKNKINEIVGKMTLEKQLNYYEGVNDKTKTKEISSILFDQYISETIQESSSVYSADALIKRGHLDKAEIIEKGSGLLKKLLKKGNLYYYPANIIVEESWIPKESLTKILEEAFDNYMSKKDFHSALEIFEKFSIRQDRSKEAAQGGFDTYLERARSGEDRGPTNYEWAANLAREYDLGEDLANDAAEKGAYGYMSENLVPTNHIYAEELIKDFELHLDKNIIREIFKEHLSGQNHEAALSIAENYDLSEKEKVEAAELYYEKSMKKGKEKSNRYKSLHFGRAKEVARQYSLGSNKYANAAKEEFKVTLAGHSSYNYEPVSSARRIQLENCIDVDEIVLGKLEKVLSKGRLKAADELINTFDLENLPEAKSYVELNRVLQEAK
jgi:hypothetical protein